MFKICMLFSCCSIVFLNIGLAFSAETSLCIESANSAETFFCKVDPRNTYLYTDPNDIYIDPYVPLSPGEATSLDLAGLANNQGILLEAGDFLSLEAVGDFRYGQSFFTETGTTMVGVFAGAGGAMMPAGPDTTATPYITSPALSSGNSTDVPYDFLIPNDHAVLVEVPEGATKLLFTADDGNFANNIDLDQDFGVWVKITIVRLKFKKIVVENGIGNPNLNASFITMEPSIDTMKTPPCYPKKILSKQKIMLKCFSAGKVPSSDCEFKLDLSLGAENGGHDSHTHVGIRPLGHLHKTDESKIEENQTYDIPKDGLAIIYTAPEVSGTVVLRFEVTDKTYGTKIKAKPTIFRVKVPGDFQKIQIPNLKFDITTHANEGYYGLPGMITGLNKLMTLYQKYAVELKVPKENIVSLESEAASMSWGGLFDIDRNWKEQHCAHRDGRSLDLSMSVFNGSPYRQKLRDALEKAVDKSAFRFYEGESPRTPLKNHWHIDLK